MSLSSDLLNIFGELGCSIVENIDLDSISLIDFCRILNWISLQLEFFAKTDSIINIIKDESDIDSLKIELSSLLNEVGSIFANSFVLDDVVYKRQLILHSLAGDLLAARINYVKKFDENLDIFTNKVNPKNDLKIINNCLSISTDSKNVETYFQTIKQKLNKSLLKYQEDDSLLLPNNEKLTPEQWNELKKLNEKLANEYSLRREMLIRRADMTIGSFSWNEDKTREVDEKTIQNIYQASCKRWSITPQVTFSHALASRSSDCDLLINKRISVIHASCFIETKHIGKANTGLQQRLQLHKFLIGEVPDRGGRPLEQPPPPKETFAQQQSQRDNQGKGRGGHQGGNDHRRYHQQQNYNQSNYQTQNRFHNLGGRIQNAGWQQQGQGHQYHNRDNNNYYQGRNENSFRPNQREGVHGGNRGHYYQRGGKGGRREGNYYYH